MNITQFSRLHASHLPSKITSLTQNPNSIASELQKIEDEQKEKDRIKKKPSMREPLTYVKIHSRKIKKSSPSSPFTSVLTRSKARIFSHQNRSGFSRPDPVTSKHIPEMEPLDSFLGVKCRGASRVFLTKDLRHKRVFTPDIDSVPQEENEDENDERKKLLKGYYASTDPDGLKEEDGLEEIRIVRSEAEGERIDGANGLNLKDQAIPKNKMAFNGCRRRKVFKTPSSFSYRRMLPHLMDIVNDTTSVSEIEIVDAGSPCKFPKLDGVNFKMRSVAEDRYAAKTEWVAPQSNDSKPSENLDIEKVHIKLFSIQPDLSTANTDVEEKGRANDVNGIDASVEEEHIQTTPPDTGLFAKIEDGYGGESVDASKVLAESQTFVGLSVGSEKNSSDTIKQSPNTKCGPNSMNTTVLNPCSRLKLFKNPRSLSYRRLLPFLTDISKNSSCSSRKPQLKMPQVVSQEDRHPAVAAGAEQDNVNNTAKQNYEKKCSEDPIQDNLFSMVPLPASDGSSPDSNNNLVSSSSESPASNYSSNVGPRSVNFVTFPDLGMLTEEIPRSQNNPAKLQLDLGSKESNSTVSEPSSIVNNDILTVQCTSEEPKSVEKQKMCLSMGLELHNDNAESIELVNLKQHSFQIKVSDALVSPKNRPFKGILKRNRQGCRGLCNCLNCASFRLHAERAFEFSRNQLHDAGEVASELMKELANLRLLLQKSITENDDSSNLQPHPVHIKQACTKALEAEILAKERLDQLNNDLSAHCKTPTDKFPYLVVSPTGLAAAQGHFCLQHLKKHYSTVGSMKLDRDGGNCTRTRVLVVAFELVVSALVAYVSE